MELTEGLVEEDRPAPTAPANMMFSMRAFADEERARALGSRIYAFMVELSRYIDCSRLDGVTVAFDFDQALAELDRGYETERVLKATSDMAVGIAMTPGVLRDGQHRSHIVLNAAYLIEPMETDGHEDFDWAVHMLAHEMAHVEVTAAFDKAFPGVLLRQRANFREGLRGSASMSCWDEYAVTRQVALIARDPLPDYTQTLLEVLEPTEQLCRDMVARYFRDGDLNTLVDDMYYRNGSLLKYAAYFAGTMVGQGKTLRDVPTAWAVMEGSWFLPFFERLVEAMAEVHGRLGLWEDMAEFDVVADIVEDMIAEFGVALTPWEDGFWADIQA
jgi:hypothetical protein